MLCSDLGRVEVALRVTRFSISPLRFASPICLRLAECVPVLESFQACFVFCAKVGVPRLIVTVKLVGLMALLLGRSFCSQQAFYSGSTVAHWLPANLLTI